TVPSKRRSSPCDRCVWTVLESDPLPSCRPKSTPMGGLSRTMRSLTSTSICAFLLGVGHLGPPVSPFRLAAPTTGAFHPAEVLALILAEVRPVELGGGIQLQFPVAAHVIPHPALTDPAVQHVPAHLAGVREEMPVVAGHVEAPDPGRAADADQCPAHIRMRPDRLAPGDLGQGPVRRLLAVDAAERDRGEAAVD